MKYKAPKGTRDFLPEEKILRNKIVSTLKNVFEKYGFNPIETPALEMYNTCTAKFSAGEGTDVLEELFTLKDRADRIMGLRYELTFPFARVIANNPQIPKPFKKYQIGRVWRNGPVKLGRYREFWQADVDVIGSENIYLDAEILALAQEVFQKLNLKTKIKINNINLLNEILEFYEIPEKLKTQVIISIDKLEKLGKQKIIKELTKKKLQKDKAEKILELLEINDLKIIESKIGKNKGIDELKELFSALKKFDVKNYEFCSNLARGLIYYTGTIFEVYLENSEITSSIAAGGRWDNMISKFAGTKEKIPAVGISFGIDVMMDAIKIETEKFDKSIAEVFVIPIKEINESIKIVNKLRKSGIKSDIDLTETSISKNLEYANSLGISKVIIVGPKDLEKNKVTLKNMKTGKEKKIELNKIISELKKE